MADHDASAVLVPLQRPRALTAEERALLDAMAAMSGGSDLIEQVVQAEVVAICSCGCPSLGLATQAPPLPAGQMRRLDDRGREDVASIVCTGTADDGREIEVILHVASGRIVELEVWAGTWRGDPVTDLPVPETLRAPAA